MKILSKNGKIKKKFCGFSDFSEEVIEKEMLYDIVIYLEKDKDNVVILKNRYGVTKKLTLNNSINDLFNLFYDIK